MSHRRGADDENAECEVPSNTEVVMSSTQKTGETRLEFRRDMIIYVNT